MVELQNGNLISTIEYEEIPQKFIQILLYLEDKHFFNHSGFDIFRIAKTFFSNIFSHKTYGASTITQQYIKNVYLNQKKTISRKIIEAFLSVSLERNEDKETILSAYCSTIYLGNGQYGIKNAAKYYFNKDLTELTINEMVLLCTILKAPTTYDPVANKASAMNKKDELLTHLLEGGIITNQEYNKAFKASITPVCINVYPSDLLFYLDVVKQELKDFDYNFELEETIKIYTMYNPTLQSVKRTKVNGDYAALIADKNGYLQYCIGGVNYYNSSYNIAYNGKRDIASTIKPLLYYEALKCGFSTSTTFTSSPYTIIYKDVSYTFNNFGNIYPSAPINMQYALATSDNIYAVKMHMQLGMRTLVNHLNLYGVEAQAIPSLALGSVSMSLKKLVEIYQCFQNNGKYHQLKTIHRVVTPKQEITRKIKNSQLLEESYTKVISLMMQGMFDQSIASNVTGSSIANKLPCIISGKSGLSNYDSYMIGYNDEYIIGCWSGYSTNKYLEDSELKAYPKKLFLNYFNNLSY